MPDDCDLTFLLSSAKRRTRINATTPCCPTATPKPSRHSTWASASMTQRSRLACDHDDIESPGRTLPRAVMSAILVVIVVYVAITRQRCHPHSDRGNGVDRAPLAYRSSRPDRIRRTRSRGHLRSTVGATARVDQKLTGSNNRNSLPKWYRDGSATKRRIATGSQSRSSLPRGRRCGPQLSGQHSERVAA